MVVVLASLPSYETGTASLSWCRGPMQFAAGSLDSLLIYLNQSKILNVSRACKKENRELTNVFVLISKKQIKTLKRGAMHGVGYELLDVLRIAVHFENKILKCSLNSR
ncbi:hypothetical protein NC653_030183 [Populus alba x Populus x berolinensis]|uniref:Uncharacterized protein n=1 Tax=Populus alba x Populus x berolinensis TaxID=444605 RepID=A0AAD6LVI5_9ROSI|nr:hypothetical protein NC653_030183 [Populus alba x Populus x berolinensis]